MSLVQMLTLLIVLGIASQWLAWRLSFPAIVLMSLAGLAIGPIFGLVNPRTAMGPDLYEAAIALSVALILFEGALSLDFRQVRGLKTVILRIVVIGALLACFLTTIAAHLIIDVPLAVAGVLGGLFIVTGPTVILPLLRQAGLHDRISNLLKWEGIIVDPFGAIVALSAYALAIAIKTPEHHLSELALYGLYILAAGILGFLFGLAMYVLLDRNLLPQFLISSVIVVSVLALFTLANSLAAETGLLAVTVYGLVLANSKLEEIGEVRHFKENITTLLTSTVFIILTASLSREVLKQVATPRILLFVLAMLFLVRPLSILIATIGSDLDKNERLLLAWIAPRGIVALTVAGYFTELFKAEGYAQAEIVLAITFALVFITVCVHGFSLAPLARRLNLSWTGNPGLVLVGANPFTIALAQTLERAKVPTLIVDYNYSNLIPVRQLGLNAHFGEILHEVDDYRLSLSRYEHMLIDTPSPSYNALVASSFIPNFGRANIYRMNVQAEEKRFLFKKMTSSGVAQLRHHLATHYELNHLLSAGGRIRSTPLTETYNWEHYLADLGEGAIPLGRINVEGEFNFYTTENALEGKAGERIISLVTPDISTEKEKSAKAET